MAMSLPLHPGAPLISERFKKNMKLWESNHFLSLPNELINEVASYLDDPQDIFKLRLTSMRLSDIHQPWFFCMLTKHKIIYRMKCLSLVSEGLRMNEYGYEWAWEQMALEDDVTIRSADDDIMDKINRDHYTEVNNNGAFLTGGGFRSTLAAILAECPNLKAIDIRKIKPDEHIPGWTDTELFKKLSFYRPGLHFNGIFYGDWQYDTKHSRVTQYVDEFGDIVSEPDAGPQACFKDDVEAAIGTRVNDIKINYLD